LPPHPRQSYTVDDGVQPSFRHPHNSLPEESCCKAHGPIERCERGSDTKRAGGQSLSHRDLHHRLRRRWGDVPWQLRVRERLHAQEPASVPKRQADVDATGEGTPASHEQPHLLRAGLEWLLVAVPFALASLCCLRCHLAASVRTSARTKWLGRNTTTTLAATGARAGSRAENASQMLGLSSCSACGQFGVVRSIWTTTHPLLEIVRVLSHPKRSAGQTRRGGTFRFMRRRARPVGRGSGCRTALLQKAPQPQRDGGLGFMHHRETWMPDFGSGAA
jgi:hypothetical protein